MIPVRIALATAAMAVLMASWLGWRAAAATAAPPAVTIQDFSFGPAVLTVARGTQVTWTNKDDDPHTVASADGGKLFKSSALDTDNSYSFLFTEAGTFKYFCTIHPRMQGTVVVQ